MIDQNDKTENTQNEFSKAISELKIGKLLRASNITKNCGVPAYEVFQVLLLLVFQGKNLFRFLNSKHKGKAVSKNTYYRFLNETSYNWKKFLLLLATKVTSAFDRLTRPERIKVFILDDSVIKRNRSQKVKLLARVYDHVEHKFQKGFTLTLGWSDGYGFVPVGFNILSSASKSNRYEEISDTIDHRTNGYKARKESLLSIWMHRNKNDPKTYGELFFMLCDDIQDTELTNALQGLMSLFTDIDFSSLYLMQVITLCFTMFENKMLKQRTLHIESERC